MAEPPGSPKWRVSQVCSARDGQRDADADGDAGERQPQEGEAGRGQRKAAGHRGGDGEAEAYQAAGVVQQRLAFEDVHQPLRDRRARGDGADGHRVGRRDDGRQREGDRQRHGRNHPVDQEAGADHGEHHQAERQFEDDALVAQQPAFGDAPAVQEQQRRQEQQEEHVRSSSTPCGVTVTTSAPSAICTSGSGSDTGSRRAR